MSVEPDFSLHPDPALARAAANDLFDRMAVVLRRLLPASADILHVGATAVPGCLTKGDLDIVVRVEAVDFGAADMALAAHFARNTGSSRTDTFCAFEDDGATPHLGIQLTAQGAPSDFFHTFSEALKSDADLLARYNALKQQYDGHPMHVYRAAKSSFIEQVLTQPECS
jgi:GrpB-like predicted nucleotidyltransferase (UPF0157 family)